LDPLPYNGHTTSLDAFWMGVPVLTLLGKTVVGRAGWSQLCNLGLQELAAETPEQFVALAARVAADLPRLQELRATLRERMEQSPLMDGKRFARNVEQAFRQMWRRWCQQERPQEVSKAIAPDQPISGPNDIAGISLPQALDLAWKHFQAGRLNQAEQLYRQILDADANQVDALHLLGVIAGQTGRNDLAVKYLDAALCLKPDLAQAHSNRGIALAGQGKLAEAEASFVRALCLKPDFADAHVNLGHAVRDQGRLDDALDAYLAALALKPDSPYIHSSLIGVLNYHPGYDAAAIHEECRRWNQRYAEPLNKLILPHANPPDPERRLRVGYVSPDFREHVDSFFTVPLLSNHDHRQYEICCYADVAFPDALTERLRGFADLWRSTVGLSDQQVADIIRADQIDILVDLEMHLANNRLLMFARKPAPVQVCWLGCPGGTGLSAMDYRLTDPYLDPPGLFDGFYSEESIRLPDTFWCYDPLTDQPPVNALPALANGVITFGCLNNFCKINDGVLALWAKVLQAVPQSRLLMLAPQGQPREHVLLRLKQNGIDSARVDFVHKRRRLEYLQLYQRIDLGLDPLPYNGHTTSLDGFWMGVPTLTLLGKTVVGRAGWSQLCNLGLQELAAQTPEQFVALAARVAADLPRLQELRATLRQRMQQSPLMDGKRFARHMEQAYRQMWRRWCGQRSNRT
ncbi:MAG TPA: tetratricopeptide repeat protein, partial [Gemmataceae bacterium]|nr:tetratricopeptide repeat protein [Gemmataceae bacterium]